jgi:hypothetical protein
MRWSQGRDAGWEITRMDEASRAWLADFVEQFKAADLTLEITNEMHWRQTTGGLTAS